MENRFKFHISQGVNVAEAITDECMSCNDNDIRAINLTILMYM